MKTTKRNYEQQTIGKSTTVDRCCVSWTGGKDCNLALLHAWRNPSLNVTSLVLFKPDNKKDFDAHPIRMIQEQSKALGLPLLVMTIDASQSYRQGYINAFKILRDEYQMTVIVTGDMDLVGNSVSNWMEDCADMVEGSPKLKILLPLWKALRRECLQTLLNENFHVIFSCVKSPWFDKSWCGRALDHDTLEQMEAKSTETSEIQPKWHPRDPRLKPLDLGGENGEYHTMVLDGPMYKHSIEFCLSNLKVNITEPAKDGEERWWTYDGQITWSLGEDFDMTIKRKESK